MASAPRRPAGGLSATGERWPEAPRRRGRPASPGRAGWAHERAAPASPSSGARIRSARRVLDHRRQERVADPRHRPDEPLDPRLVADRLADLGDDLGEAGVADVGLRPQRVPQLPLRDGPRPALDQQREEEEAARRDGHDLPRPAAARAGRSRACNPRRQKRIDAANVSSIHRPRRTSPGPGAGHRRSFKVPSTSLEHAWTCRAGCSRCAGPRPRFGGSSPRGVSVRRGGGSSCPSRGPDAGAPSRRRRPRRCRVAGGAARLRLPPARAARGRARHRGDGGAGRSTTTTRSTSASSRATASRRRSSPASSSGTRS